jgi:hypothetical protein
MGVVGTLMKGSVGKRATALAALFICFSDEFLYMRIQALNTQAE